MCQMNGFNAMSLRGRDRSRQGDVIACLFALELECRLASRQKRCVARSLDDDAAPRDRQRRPQQRVGVWIAAGQLAQDLHVLLWQRLLVAMGIHRIEMDNVPLDRKSTRLNSSH